MKLNQATKILGAKTHGAAGARTIIKRTLRKMQLPAPDDAESLAGFFIANPWACTVAIERRLQDSARAYERNDHAREQLCAEHVETLMAVLDVQLDWPGLYPTYNYVGKLPKGFPPGKFGECYNLSSLWSLLRDIRNHEEG